VSRLPVDLVVVRAARRRLEQLARDHPKAFDPDRLPTTPRKLMQAMKRVGRPPAEDPMVVVPARLPRSMVAALDALLQKRRAEQPEATRQDLLREAIGRFLRAERRKAGKRRAVTET
jgi:hypothetical protein